MFRTEQENFWASEFGNEYIGRNDNEELLAGNISFFSKVINRTVGINSVIEFGANIGLNLRAIKQLLPHCELSAIEINQRAVEVLKEQNIKTYNQSMLNFEPDYKRDLAFTKTVLIHINPDELKNVYQKLYDSSNKYILVAEYYNPVPVTVPYRGYNDRLFKRDFAGEMLDNFSDLELVDYGFLYHKDNNDYLYDDINWFLMKKC